MKRRVLIMGAAGRDFHNFNINFRDNDEYEVVAFTATQIPNIDGKKYPPSLAGKLYPEGIPILSEDDLEELITGLKVDVAVFSYSDIDYDYVMNKAAIVNALGADFWLLGNTNATIKTEKPLITICGVRTGAGKSEASRPIVRLLKSKGVKVVTIRHPMPYGDLAKQKVQRYASLEDLKKHDCTIEEMEEYEPHIEMGSIIYAGVDYEAILKEAEQEADVIIWDGGNNDTSFYRSDKQLNIVLTDPRRAGHELRYYSGETNLLMADVVVVNRLDTSDLCDILELRDNIRDRNPKATVIDAVMPVKVDKPEIIAGKKVLVIEDGPTHTHGEMEYGEGIIAATKYGASELVDPRDTAVGLIAETFEIYPDIGTLLPAMGYGAQQKADLEKTINNTECDVVVSATPIDITRIIKINKPVARVTFEVEEIGRPNFEDVLKDFF